MQPQKWISVNYLRLGYEEDDSKNPVVIWITVEKDQVDPVEAQRVSDLIHRECIL